MIVQETIMKTSYFKPESYQNSQAWTILVLQNIWSGYIHLFKLVSLLEQ